MRHFREGCVVVVVTRSAGEASGRLYCDQASPRVSFLATSTVFGSYPANEYWLTVRWIPEFRV